MQRQFRTGPASAADRDDILGRTALLWAAGGTQLHVVQWLLRAGGSHVSASEANTALLGAVFSCGELSQFLVRECGADTAEVSGA